MNLNAELLSLGQNSFRNQVFEKKLVFNDGDYRETEFINCVFEKGIELNYSRGKFFFDNCTFVHTDDVKLFFIEDSKVEIKTCTFKGNLILIGVENVYMLNSDVDGIIEFRNSKKENIKIENKEPGHHIRAIWVSPIDTKESSLEFYKLNVEELDFSNYVPNKIRLWGGEYDNVNLDDARNLNNLQIWGDDHLEKAIQIGKLSMTYLNLEGDILLKFARIKKLDITPFTTKKGFMRWQGVKFLEDGEVKVEHSNLENVQWNGVDFKNTKLHFDWSMFSKMEIANVLWPEKYIIHPDLVKKKQQREGKNNLFYEQITDEEQEQYLVQREIYRQLKSLSLSNNNRIDGLAFYKNEMSVYWNYVKWGKDIGRWDRFLIRLDKVVSDFGQSYLRPLGLLVFFHLLVCISIWTFESHDYMFWNGDFFSGLKEYFHWLIPVYKAPPEWGTMAVVSGVLGRIFGGFFIYHLIKASRKFAKV